MSTGRIVAVVPCTEGPNAPWYIRARKRAVHRPRTRNNPRVARRNAARGGEKNVHRYAKSTAVVCPWLSRYKNVKTPDDDCAAKERRTNVARKLRNAVCRPANGYSARSEKPVKPLRGRCRRSAATPPGGAGPNSLMPRVLRFAFENASNTHGVVPPTGRPVGYLAVGVQTCTSSVRNGWSTLSYPKSERRTCTGYAAAR